MKHKMNPWMTLSTAALMTVAIATQVNAQSVQTPLPSPIVVSGTAGGGQSSSCGFVSRTPSQVVQVTEQFTSLNFKVEASGGTPTLMIAGPGGRTQCAMASSFADGVINVPGVWQRGTYSLFVGDRTQGSSNRYTLSITQE